jgi:hypothetical protein
MVKITRQRYLRPSKEIYVAVLFCLEARNKHSEDLSKFNCLHFDKGKIWEWNSSDIFRVRRNVHLKANNVLHGSMKNLVEILLCLPGNNASTGGNVFPYESEENPWFHFDKIQAILTVKTNIICHVKHLVNNLHRNLECWRRYYISQIIIMQYQGSPLQNNQVLLKIIISLILHFLLLRL